MGASASKKDDATSKQGAPTRGPITFDQDTLRFVDGGPPPPPSETSTRLQSRCHDMFRRRTEKARTKQAPRAMSTLEALGAAKISLGEDAVAAAFGAEEDYLASIRNEPTITGTAPRLPWLGPRTFAARSPHAQAIQALDAQRTGAAILPAPGGAAGAGGDATRPWEGLPLVASSSARRDESLNHWEEWLRSGEKPYEVLWDDGNWPADEEPEEWNDFGAPYGPPPPFMNLNKVNRYYRGPLPDGVSIDRMSKKACGTDPTMLAHWARAEYYSRVRARYDAELAAYRAMRAKWRAQSGGRSRRAAAGPRSYNERDAYADLTRTETDRLIEENPKKFHERHMSAMKNQIACDESLLEAIAREAGVPRCVLTALDKNERPYLLSAVIKANLPVPGLGTELVLSNWDHIDKGWEDDPSVPIRKLGLRGLIWGLLNKKLPGYEWYLARSAERVYLEGYLKGALCFDNSFGEHFVLEIPLKDESAFRGMTTQNQQTNELHYIKNHLLKGAILGATKGRFRVEATGRDAELLRILKQRFGAGLEFEHAPSSAPGGITGKFRAPNFMDRGVTYFSIDHVALGCVRRKGVLYRIVGFRGLLPQDMNMHASGYEFIKVLGLEAWVEEYRKNAYCEKGVGGLDKSKAVFDYRPDVFSQGGMRPI